MSWLRAITVVLLDSIVIIAWLFVIALVALLIWIAWTQPSWSACRIPGHCRYHYRPVEPEPPAPPPASWLERVNANGPAAEIYFPALTPGNGLETYPLLVWRQPWLDPVSSLYWPKLIDIDRTPFMAWDRRIGP
jgi:hypothetical protein